MPLLRNFNVATYDMSLYAVREKYNCHEIFEFIVYLWHSSHIGLHIHLHPYFFFASKEGTGKSVHMHGLVWAFLAR